MTSLEQQRSKQAKPRQTEVAVMIPLNSHPRAVVLIPAALVQARETGMQRLGGCLWMWGQELHPASFCSLALHQALPGWEPADREKASLTISGRKG